MVSLRCFFNPSFEYDNSLLKYVCLDINTNIPNLVSFINYLLVSGNTTTHVTDEEPDSERLRIFPQDHKVS